MQDFFHPQYHLWVRNRGIYIYIQLIHDDSWFWNGTNTNLSGFYLRLWQVKRWSTNFPIWCFIQHQVMGDLYWSDTPYTVTYCGKPNAVNHPINQPWLEVIILSEGEMCTYSHCICMYIYIYVCMYVCKYLHLYQVDECMYIYIFIRMYIRNLYMYVM